MLHDFLKLLRESWQSSPVIVVLCFLALVILAFVIFDTHRHRRRLKKERPDKHSH